MTTVNSLQALADRHPGLFRGSLPQHSYLEAGWFDLLNHLCSDVEKVLGDQSAQFRIRQIKEKYGRLRIYWSLELPTSETHIEINKGRDSARITMRPSSPMHDTIAALVDAAEKQSASKCQECGHPGRLLVLDDWWAAVCDEHSRGYDRVVDPTDEGAI